MEYIFIEEFKLIVPLDIDHYNVEDDVDSICEEVIKKYCVRHLSLVFGNRSSKNNRQ
jgi:hypothetical protein